MLPCCPFPELWVCDMARCPPTAGRRLHARQAVLHTSPFIPIPTAFETLLGAPWRYAKNLDAIVLPVPEKRTDS